MRNLGFTLMELLLVLLLVTLLASLVAPVVTGGVQRAKESTLKEDLYTMRKALDDYYADTGSYPGDLEDLVTKRYLRRIPIDPVTETRGTWQLVRSADDKSVKSVLDVRSGSQDKASDGSYFKDW